MYRFQPRLVPTLFVLAGLGILLSLGSWQLRRRAEAAGERERYAARLAEAPFDAARPPEDADLHRARLVGAPDWDRLMLIHGKYMWGKPGFQLVVPVRVEGQASGDASAWEWILVDVGWVPGDEWEQVVAHERTVGTERHYEGIARVYQETSGATGAYPVAGGYQRDWRAVSPLAMGQAIGRAVAPWVLVEGEGLTTDAAISDRVPPVSGWRTELQQRPHGEYAFTWFSLAVTLVLVWASASTRRAAPAQPAPPR